MTGCCSEGLKDDPNKRLKLETHPCWRPTPAGDPPQPSLLREGEPTPTLPKGRSFAIVHP